MAIRITIAGLNRIGASIGLGLGRHKEVQFERTGYDPDMETAKRAQKMGAIDSIDNHLDSAVRQADIVMLALPADALHEAIEMISGELKEDAVLLDAGPVKLAAMAWASDLLPLKRHYIGMMPVINPAYVLESNQGLEAARADLFERGLFAIVAPSRTPPEALKLAIDLANILGAGPLFAEALEIDGLLAATHLLPQLMAIGLLNATIDQPGWRDASKFADFAYSQATAPGAFSESPKAVISEALFNKENILRLLDRAIGALQGMRAEIQDNEVQVLEERIEQARQGRSQWLQDRLRANWSEQGLPESVARATKDGNLITRLFGTGFKKRDQP
jgi:prephenate dehydrogenase